MKSGKSDRLPLRVTPYADIDAGAVTGAGMGTNVVRSTTMACRCCIECFGTGREWDFVLGAKWAAE